MKRKLCFVLCTFLLQVIASDPANSSDRSSGNRLYPFLQDDTSGPGHPHIIGGKEVSPHSHPHQIALILNPHSGIDSGFCGGSLISDLWALTAAHCTDFPYYGSWIVKLGAHRIREEENSTQSFSVSDVVLHPRWVKQYLENDISLLRLWSPAKLDQYVYPIRLPSAGQKNWSFWSYQVTMTGWGFVSDNDRQVNPTLQAVDTRIITNWFCWMTYLFSTVKATNICSSGFFKKGHCNGDSGGPMSVREEDGIRTLVGIQSFGINIGCEKSWPSVSTRVASYLDWIRDTTDIPIRP